MPKVGIDAMYVYVPRYHVDNSELATARNEDPEHFTEGVGIKRFAIPGPNEDQASMAATAAYRLLESGISPKEIFRIDTPTESGLDASRALVSDVVGMLEQVYGKGSFSHVLGYEQKFACVSGMERLLDTAAWFAAEWNPRKYGLVLATDIAKYNLGSREEPTQGAAAAALLIGANPRLLEIIPGALGSALRHEKGDFKKPGGRTIALVDGQKSYASYLSEMKEAWLNFSDSIRKIAFMKPKPDESILDNVSRAIYHNPHKKMVMGAYASLLMHEWRNLPRWRKITAEIGDEPSRSGISDVDYYLSSPYQEYRRKFMKSNWFLNSFDEKIGSSTTAPELVGNSYSASVFVGLDSVLENDKSDLTDTNVILCAYGSGSHAIIQANIFRDGYRHEVKKLDLMSRLGTSEKLSIAEYERIHRGEIPPDRWQTDSRRMFRLGSVGAAGTSAEGDREYVFVE
jgi:hydroxymethylglutaryl-CoA synthase